MVQNAIVRITMRRYLFSIIWIYDISVSIFCPKQYFFKFQIDYGYLDTKYYFLYEGNVRTCLRAMAAG